MCGIGGIYLKKNQHLNLQPYLKSMLCSQAHRGPDADGVWIADDMRLGLCHNRLSILDLTPDGNQPMHSIDNRFTIVFNGEIYNYVELRQKLESLGRSFRTQTDTEVLLEAYRHWGEDMLSSLRGMFSFALYDRLDGSLFCARDPIGKKPFVYSQTMEGFVFASEIPSVRLVIVVLIMMQLRQCCYTICVISLTLTRHIVESRGYVLGMQCVSEWEL